MPNSTLGASQAFQVLLKGPSLSFPVLWKGDKREEDGDTVENCTFSLHIPTCRNNTGHGIRPDRQLLG